MELAQLEMNDRRLTDNQIKSKIDKLLANKLPEDEVTIFGMSLRIILFLQEFCETIDYLQGLVGNAENVNERQLRIALQDRELQLNRQFLENFEKVSFVFVSKIIRV